MMNWLKRHWAELLVFGAIFGVFLLCAAPTGCSSPGVANTPPEETMSSTTAPREPKPEPEPEFLPNFPWGEIGWTVSREGCARDGMIVSLANWHPHPSIVGLPEEIPGTGWPTDSEQVRYLSHPRTVFTELGGTKVFLLGFDSTFIYEEEPNRGYTGLQNPTYQELLDFLAQDKTDQHKAIRPTFMCQHFAEMLQKNANEAGWRCALLPL